MDHDQSLVRIHKILDRLVLEFEKKIRTEKLEGAHYRYYGVFVDDCMWKQQRIGWYGWIEFTTPDNPSLDIGWSDDRTCRALGLKPGIHFASVLVAEVMAEKLAAKMKEVLDKYDCKYLPYGMILDENGQPRSMFTNHVESGLG